MLSRVASETRCLNLAIIQIPLLTFDEIQSRGNAVQRLNNWPQVAPGRSVLWLSVLSGLRFPTETKGKYFMYPLLLCI